MALQSASRYMWRVGGAVPCPTALAGSHVALGGAWRPAMVGIPGPQAQNGNLSRADDVEGGSVIFELLLIRQRILSAVLRVDQPSRTLK